MLSPEGAGAAESPPRSPEPAEVGVGTGRQEAEEDVPRLCRAPIPSPLLCGLTGWSQKWSSLSP